MIGRRSLLGVAAGLAAGIVSPLGAALSPLVRHGQYFFIPVSVNGVSFDALLDSGAEMTVLDSAVAARLGLSGSGSANLTGSGGGKVPAKFIAGVAIKAAGIGWRPAKVVVVDLTDIGNRLVKGPVDMILGRDFFDSAVLAIDFQRQFLDTLAKGARRPGQRVPLTKAFGIETIPIRIDGKPAQATFDTGNAGRLLLSEDFARRSGLLGPDRRIGTDIGGGVGGQVARPLVKLRSVEIAGRRIPVTEAAVGKSEHSTDATIGLDTLRHFRLICDFAGRAIWFDPV